MKDLLKNSSAKKIAGPVQKKIFLTRLATKLLPGEFLFIWRSTMYRIININNFFPD